jgi:hypothetical protein
MKAKLLKKFRNHANKLMRVRSEDHGYYTIEYLDPDPFTDAPRFVAVPGEFLEDNYRALQRRILKRICHVWRERNKLWCDWFSFYQ